MKRTRSAQGTSRCTSSAQRTSSSCEAPQWVPSVDLPLDGLDHGRMGVAEQQRAVAAEVVDVLVAVDVPLARARARCGIDRIGQSVRESCVSPAGIALQACW